MADLNTTAETPAAPEQTEMNFEDAFSTFLKEDNAPPAPVPPVAPSGGGEEVVSEIETPAPVEEAPAEEVDPEALRQPAENEQTAIERLADAIAARQQPEPQPQRPQPQPVPVSPFSAEERTVLQQFYTDFPEVARAASIERRAEYQALTAHIFNQVGAYFGPRMALLEQLADRTMLTDLTTTVPDYDATRDQVIEWVKTQPAYLQSAYNHVIANGTVDEIGDLFDRYRQATGTTSPQPNAEIAPQPQAARQVSQPPATKAPELSPAAKQAAARLAPVTSKRSAPTQQSPLDFESAFDQFAKAV